MTALCSGKICTIFPEKGALNLWKACTIALEYSPFIRSSKSIMRRFASNSSFLSSVLSFSHCNSYCAFNCSTNSFSSLRTYCDTLLVEVFFRQCKTRLALDTYQIRSSKGIQRYWLLMSMAHYICVIGTGRYQSFQEGHQLIRNTIQQEKYNICFNVQNPVLILKRL